MCSVDSCVLFSSKILQGLQPRRQRGEGMKEIRLLICRNGWSLSQATINQPDCRSCFAISRRISQNSTSRMSRIEIVRMLSVTLKPSTSTCFHMIL